ncbi:MAG: WXG100 family type VII secretion target [Cryobacterium sp.]|nr:WXG100 family type VII secretion target [Cryobacterium sp.]
MSLVLNPPADPAYWLQDPSAPGSGDRIWALRESAGVVLGGIDTVVSWLSGFSPLQEWVAKPLGGDWGALDRGAVAWKNAGKAVGDLLENIEALPGQIGDSWQGSAAVTFQESQLKLARAATPLVGGCDAMSELCTALADMAQAITEFVLAIANALAEFILELTIALATVVGGVTTPVWITKLVTKLGIWTPKLIGMINTFFGFVGKIAGFMEIFKKVFAKLKAIAELLMTVSSQLDQTQRAVDEAARQVDEATRYFDNERQNIDTLAGPSRIPVGADSSSGSGLGGSGYSGGGGGGGGGGGR